MMATLLVSFSLMGASFGAVARWWRLKVERCVSTASTTLGLDDVVQRGLGDGRGMVNSHRVEALPDIMVASTAKMTKIMQFFFI
jgi:hypothetical protein